MSERELLKLPNGDLWRGHKHEEPVKVETTQEVLDEEIQDPMNKTMAKIHANAKGARDLTCIWCGQQGNDAWMRGHIKSLHKTVLQPVPTASIAVAEAESARAELAAMKAKVEE